MVELSRKQSNEMANFAAFRRACPNFAGRPLKSVRLGADPPDILCFDEGRNPIGIELVQWVNQAQIAQSKKRFALEKSYLSAIRSSHEQAPSNIRMIFLYPKDNLVLGLENAGQFRRELYDLIGQVDASWPGDPERYQGMSGVTEFSNHPCLAQHLTALHFFPANGRRLPSGWEWITFKPRGGPYTTNWMRDALLENIKRKINRYARPGNQERLKEQNLTEFDLLAYHDEAVLHNTPYHAPGFGFREIAAVLTSELTSKPHPFDKVFLYSPLETPAVIQVV